MKFSSCVDPENGDDDTNCNDEDEFKQESGKDVSNEEISRRSKIKTLEFRK